MSSRSSIHSQTPSARRTLNARDAFTASLHSVGTSYNADYQARASLIHSNSAALNTQHQNLTKATASLQKDAKQWSKLADESAQGLKELGDCQNWAEMLERDLLVLETTMDIVDGERKASAQGGQKKKGGKSSKRW